MVYVGTANGLVAYGLLLPPTSAPAAPSNLAAKTVSASEIDLSWELNSIDAATIQDGACDGQPAVRLRRRHCRHLDQLQRHHRPAGHPLHLPPGRLQHIGTSRYSNTADATHPADAGRQTGRTQTSARPPFPGSASYDANNKIFSVTGSGNDIWNNADEFHFVYQQLIGDGTITAQVLTQDYTDPWAKAGVMIRETPDGDSTQAIMAMTPGNGTTFQYRNQTGGPSSDGADVGGNYQPDLGPPHPLGRQFHRVRQLRRRGSWQDVASITIPMNTAVYAGLAVYGAQRRRRRHRDVRQRHARAERPGSARHPDERGGTRRFGTQIANQLD